jgi:RNA-directed DNA polymerase
MDTRAGAADHLAAKLLAQPWTPDAIASVIEAVHARTRRALAARVTLFGHRTYPPAPHALAAFLIECRFFRPPRDGAVAVALDSPRFAPIAAFADLPVPPLATPGELGEWLGQPPDHLDWLAGARRGHDRTVEPSFQHYHYGFISRPRGGFRLIEAPKPRLKAIQRRILRDILSRVPVHGRAHGFVAGRSCLSGAQLLADEAVVATFDLARFFPSIGLPRIHGLIRCLG